MRFAVRKWLFLFLLFMADTMQYLTKLVSKGKLLGTMDQAIERIWRNHKSKKGGSKWGI